MLLANKQIVSPNMMMNRKHIPDVFILRPMVSHWPCGYGGGSALEIGIMVYCYIHYY